MICYDLDDETMHLVLQLQMEDLEDLRRTSKGKHRANEIPDSDLAIDFYKSELVSQAQFVSDRHMCKSIARANSSDSRVIDALVAQERQAQRDREMALRLSRGEAIGKNSEEDEGTDAGAPCLDDELLQKLKSLYGLAGGTGDGIYDDDDILMQPESALWGGSRAQASQARAGNKRQRRECISCLTEHHFTDVARCPCDHEYCRACLRTLFETSFTDESLFPPRCCSKAIPVESNRIFLSSKLVGEFRAKALEFSTPNRTYCHKPACSTFVPLEFVRDGVATCPKCHSRTCTMCKGAHHGNRDCQQDTATQTLLQVASQNGWQRCYSCRRLVELDTGCNHMTCRCGAQFCYLCGERWKTCTCAQWNEERLFARANVIVNRDANVPALQPQIRAQQMEREVQNLVENHECDHVHWIRRSTSGECEECHDYMRRFIFECTHCRPASSGLAVTSRRFMSLYHHLFYSTSLGLPAAWIIIKEHPQKKGRSHSGTTSSDISSAVTPAPERLDAASDNSQQLPRVLTGPISDPEKFGFESDITFSVPSIQQNRIPDHINSIPINYSRVDVAAIIRNAVNNATPDQRVLVMGCGPEGLMTEVRNTTASCIRTSGPAVELHYEQFGW